MKIEINNVLKLVESQIEALNNIKEMISSLNYSKNNCNITQRITDVSNDYKIYELKKYIDKILISTNKLHKTLNNEL